MVIWFHTVILFSCAVVQLVHPAPKYFEEVSVSFNNPSSCAFPISVAVSDFPADAQYQLLSLVNVPKYFSNTIFPSFNTRNPLVLFVSRKSYKESILSAH